MNGSVEFVEAPHLESLFSELSKDAEALDIAVAFVTREGFKIVEEPIMDMLKKNRRIRAVLGLSNHLRITDEDAVKDLLKLKRKNNRCLELKYYDHPGFHPKLFVFYRNGQNLDAIIGSSNLTRGWT